MTVWSVAHQTPLSMGFFRQEYWSGLPFPSPGDRPNLGVEPGSPALQADSLPSEPPGKPKHTQECAGVGASPRRWQGCSSLWSEGFTTVEEEEVARAEVTARKSSNWQSIVRQVTGSRSERRQKHQPECQSHGKWHFH